PPTTFSPTPAPTPTPTPNPTPTPTPTSPGGTTSDWPAGTTAWTVILSSVRNETAARNSAAAASVPAGVLFSSDHPGLRPGFWVVFTGEYPTQAAAAARARALAGRYPGAYPRRITG
ncbi:MAG TPA: hypothetical protein PKE32_09595, partial [Miltoncostaeaceae bacterium]|nr:hypothetical protein [Miltoncostaeaceae bacterium]